MAEKHATGAMGAAGRAPAADRADAIRNVVLVGHSGSGKTTLVEQLLAATGTIQRTGRVEDGNTVSDFDEVEVRQQRSVNLTLAPLTYTGIKINLLDTPGYADFVGDLRAGLRAADAALFVVSACDGVDGLTRMLWEECAQVGMPRAVVITKIDHQRADFDEVLATCQDAFGDGVAPLYLPVITNGHVNGLIGLLTQKFYNYATGSRTEKDPGTEYQAQIEEHRGVLIEGIIQESEDESLMERYLEGEEIDTKRPHRRPGEGRRPGQLLPGALHRARRRRDRSCWSSSPRGSPPRSNTRCPRSPPSTASRSRASPATPRARWSPRSSRPPATRTWAGSVWSASSPARCGPT